ncbi:MAG: pyruvate dehydrogenase (acetyl-transferring) E1 component subunit alpha [Candidatus Nanoarchaeia archaeon]|jgi:pyruvate dehydrogenase E1 component alpha subunit|nr:pyruvate dehydrogenase (acetyl-transferring) E1 component subunit alpha [Candidatus Nanoarchaeia archaeon]|tara:strand:+ start:7340 stop:8392 length:1053 start_codon:yes stop_codon:yes gene_type:complete
MPKEVIHQFNVEFLSVLDEKGKVDSKLMPKLNGENIKKMFELMKLTRILDEKALKLQREGRLGTYASCLGQEATHIGSAFALGKEDFVFPSFREQGVYLSRNIPIDQYLAYWKGDERGMKFTKDANIFTVSIPVGSHMLHAMGYSWACKIKKESRAVITYFGDGATSEGDFHEAMNFASVFEVPLVFICQNNQYAISLPVNKQTKAQTIAQKAIAYGMYGIRVDGNDVFAMYRATKEALERAKKGKPTLIEALTYRRGDHTTSDDSKKYRTDREVNQWKKKDPIDRLRNYMSSKKLWAQDYEDELDKKFNEEIDEAVKKMESLEAPKREEIFNYMYSELTDNLKEQQNEK